jgi:hypothetical protein
MIFKIIIHKKLYLYFHYMNAILNGLIRINFENKRNPILNCDMTHQ